MDNMSYDYRVGKRCSAKYKCLFIIISISLFFLILVIQRHYGIKINNYTVFVPLSIYVLLLGIPTLLNIYICLFKPHLKTLKKLKKNKVITFICSEFFFQELKCDLKTFKK